MKKRAAIINITACVLMVFTVVLQFLPFWSFEDGSASIASDVWLPEEQDALQNYLEGQFGNDFTVNAIHAPFALQLVFTVIGIVMCLTNKNKSWPAVVGGISGIFGIYGFLTKPAMQLGGNWALQLIITIIMLAIAVYALIPHKEQKAA